MFTLWVLGFLTVLAVSIASGVRQKVMLVKKLDEHSRMRYMVDAGLTQAKAYIFQQMSQAQNVYTVNLKENLHNNPSVFSRISLGEDHAEVSHAFANDGISEERFGIVDEESKININTASPVVIQRLIEQVLRLKPDDAGLLTKSILDWRQWGESQLTGFFSDEYYEHLQYPYKKKDAPYEVLDELLLVKGVTKDMYERLLLFITVYAEGKININTAERPVLFALGLDHALIEKLITARSGKDGVEATPDDHIFTKTFDVATEVNVLVKLTPIEVQTIDNLNLQSLITTNSYYFTVDVKANLARSSWTNHVRAIYGSRENKILYWSRK